MARPRKPDKRQASFNDVPIEDKDIAKKLKIIADYEDKAKEVRAAKKAVKELVAAGYEDVINSDQDGEHSGYVVCGGYRFRADLIEVPERTVAAKGPATKPATQRWGNLDVHRADLFSVAPGAVS